MASCRNRLLGIPEQKKKSYFVNVTSTGGGARRIRSTGTYIIYRRSRKDDLFFCFFLLSFVLFSFVFSFSFPFSFYSGFRRCHCTMVCLGFVIMSCQCFVSLAPLPFFPENECEVHTTCTYVKLVNFFSHLMIPYKIVFWLYDTSIYNWIYWNYF